MTIQDSGTRREYIKRHVGDKQGKLTLVSRLSGGQKWLCRCECGKEVITQISGGSHACAECANKINGINMTIHGESHKGVRLYGIWLTMRTRCNNPKSNHYSYYGGRGIKVCEEWNSYETFQTWAWSNGYLPNLTINRKDNEKGYYPDNCNWCTRKEQMRNTRNNHLITIGGITQCVVDWCDSLMLYKANVYCKSKKIGISVDDYLKYKSYTKGAVCTKRAYSEWFKLQGART